MTCIVVSKELFVAPSKVREAPPIVTFATCIVLNSTASPVPSPNDVLAVAPDSVTKVEPLPTIMFESVGVNPDKACNSAS